MPVWHERTKAARESGKLVLVGIAEEQHPDRCALFAQWMRFDWPILWDPFNLTESSAVPIPIALDEHGIVRSIGLSLDGLDEFLATDFEDDAGARPQALGVRKPRAKPQLSTEGGALEPHAALSHLLWWRGESPASLDARELDACIASLERAASSADAPPSAAFRLGVAQRLRYDSAFARPQDFQASLDRWGEALRADPTQYIWRRRIQQWGPRLDKPYPFYGWIEEATRAVAERGEPPAKLAVELTSSEVSGAAPTHRVAEERSHPDPDRKVPRDESGWVSLEVAVVPHTSAGGERSGPASFQVHLALRPSAERDVHWSNDAGPVEVWISDSASVGLERPNFVLAAVGERETSSETRRTDFTVLPSDARRSVSGTAFYFVCEGRAGECRFLAQDFVIQLPTER